MLPGGTDRAYSVGIGTAVPAVDSSGTGCEFLNSVSEYIDRQDGFDPDTFATEYDRLSADKQRSVETMLTDYDAETKDAIFGTETRMDNFFELYKASSDSVDADDINTLEHTLSDRGAHLVKGSNSLSQNIDSIDSVSETTIAESGDGTTFDGVQVSATYDDANLDEPLDVNLVYPDDGQKLVEDAVEDEGWTLTSDGTVVTDGDTTTKSGVQGDLGENLDDDIARANGGEVADGFTKDQPNEGGVDLVIKEDGDEVVIETKYYSSGGLSDEQLGRGYGYPQFSDGWVEEAILRQADRGDISSDLEDKLLNDKDQLSSSVNKRVIYVQNKDSPTTTVTEKFTNTITESTYGNVDSVTIVKTGKQITDVEK